MVVKKIICPKCKEPLTQLKVWSKVDNFNFMSLSDDGLADWNDDCGGEVVYENETDLEYCCTKCFEVLFTKEDEALKFLKGEKVEATKEWNFSIEKVYCKKDGVNSQEEAKEKFIQDIAENNFEISEVKN